MGSTEEDGPHEQAVWPKRLPRNSQPRLHQIRGRGYLLEERQIHDPRHAHRVENP